MSDLDRRRETLVASGGRCAPMTLNMDWWLVDRPAWVEAPVDLRDAPREHARLAAITADVDRCRQGGRPVYKRLPPPPLRLPVFTAGRGAIRFVQPPAVGATV